MYCRGDTRSPGSEARSPWCSDRWSPCWSSPSGSEDHNVRSRPAEGPRPLSARRGIVVSAGTLSSRSFVPLVSSYPAAQRAEDATCPPSPCGPSNGRRLEPWRSKATQGGYSEVPVGTGCHRPIAIASPSAWTQSTGPAHESIGHSVIQKTAPRRRRRVDRVLHRVRTHGVWTRHFDAGDRSVVLPTSGPQQFPQ